MCKALVNGKLRHSVGSEGRRIFRHRRQKPGGVAKKSPIFAATACYHASCVRNTVATNSRRPVCDMSAHLRTFSLVPMEQRHLYCVHCDSLEKPGGKSGRFGNFLGNSFAAWQRLAPTASGAYLTIAIRAKNRAGNPAEAARFLKIVWSRRCDPCALRVRRLESG
jgi:hypothetical protein